MPLLVLRKPMTYLGRDYVPGEALDPEPTGPLRKRLLDQGRVELLVGTKRLSHVGGEITESDGPARAPLPTQTAVVAEEAIPAAPDAAVPVYRCECGTGGTHGDGSFASEQALLTHQGRMHKTATTEGA